MKNKLIAYINILFLIIQLFLSAIILLTRKQIPLHWDIYGKIDSYGSAWNIVILALLNIFFNVIFHWLKCHPEFCNFPRAFKNPNIAFKYMSNLIQWLGFYVSLLFLYITIGIIFHRIWIWFFFTLIIVFMFSIIIYIIKLWKS